MDGPVHPEGGPSEGPRAPRRSDLSRLAAELNRLGARYLIVGGFAMIEAGFPRLTSDIDLLIDPSPDNEGRVFEALRSLPDRAVDALQAGDVARFRVVRVGDEIVVDLLENSCGVTYADAVRDCVFREIDGVRIPFASPETLWRMKQTVREKDIPDRLFLRQLLDASGAPESRREKRPIQRRPWWKRFLPGP
jgi:Nucleotidyl transferase of unknown function (DUF2204)